MPVSPNSFGQVDGGRTRRRPQGLRQRPRAISTDTRQPRNASSTSLGSASASPISMMVWIAAARLRPPPSSTGVRVPTWPPGGRRDVGSEVVVEPPVPNLGPHVEQRRSPARIGHLGQHRLEAAQFRGQLLPAVVATQLHRRPEPSRDQRGGPELGPDPDQFPRDLRIQIERRRDRSPRSPPSARPSGTRSSCSER